MEAESDIFANYRHFYGEQGAFDEVTLARSCRGERLRMELPESSGRGWAEIVRLNSGPIVGMCDYQFTRPGEWTYSEGQSRLGFHLLLTGSFEVGLPGCGSQHSVNSRELWLRNGTVDRAQYLQPAGCGIRGVSIDLPLEMVNAWLGGESQGFEENLELLMAVAGGHSDRCSMPMCCAITASAPILRNASRLLTTSRVTLCDELQFESLVLDLLAQLLATDPFVPLDQRQNGLNRRQRAAVDQAIDILRGEWNDPPSITVLARRVGVNECYLKSWFRASTGLSVGEYIRQLRMDNALELIESGAQTVLEVAASVGYSNPGHFSAAFRRAHGRLPSSFLSRA